MDPAPRTLLSPGTHASPYNAASDLVLDEEIKWPEDGGVAPDTFPLALLVNETTYRSPVTDYTSYLQVLTLHTP